MKYDVPGELTVEADGAVRILTLNNPDMLNAFIEPLHYAMTWIWPQLAADDECNAVVLTAPGGRSAPAATSPASSATTRTRSSAARTCARPSRCRRTWPGSTSPSWPRSTARPWASGARWPCSCDIVYIDESTFMADPHVSIGLVAGDGGGVAWPLLMSLLKAKEYLFTGDRITAAEVRPAGPGQQGAADDRAPAQVARAGPAPREHAACSRSRRPSGPSTSGCRRRSGGSRRSRSSAESESFGTEDLRKTIETFKARSEIKGG